MSENEKLVPAACRLSFCFTGCPPTYPPPATGVHFLRNFLSCLYLWIHPVVPAASRKFTHFTLGLKCHTKSELPRMDAGLIGLEMPRKAMGPLSSYLCAQLVVGEQLHKAKQNRMGPALCLPRFWALLSRCCQMPGRSRCLNLLVLFPFKNKTTTTKPFITLFI